MKQSVRNLREATEKLDANMEALKHNFLLRHYFKKHPKPKPPAEQPTP
jgi:phospholipid/cholesterol/gamma-HCH transport system substrate-binding protein